MNICSYTPTRYLNDNDINARLRFLFKNVCYLLGNSGSGGNLQQVTDAGNTTTNFIEAQYLQVTDVANSIIITPNAGDDYIQLKPVTGFSGNWVQEFPDKSGTFAMTSDIPAAGANTALSNLAAVAVNTHLLPGTTATSDLGSGTKAWRSLYLESVFPNGCLIDFSVDGIGDTSRWQLANRQGGNAFSLYSYAATAHRFWIDEGGDFGLGGNAYLGTSATIQGTTGGLVGIGLSAAAPTERLQVNGNLSLSTAGNKIKITTGSNASIGVSDAMVAGTVTVNTTAVTASSIIFLTHGTGGGVQSGALSVGTITAGTSFVINSSNAADSGAVNWWIIN